MFDFLKRFDFWNKLFPPKETTGNEAKQRLRLVLIHDRADVNPEVMNLLKVDLIDVISKYMEIDINAIDIGFERKDGSIALAANIPVIRLRNLKDNIQKEEQKVEVNVTDFSAKELVNETMKRKEEQAPRETSQQTQNRYPRRQRYPKAQEEQTPRKRARKNYKKSYAPENKSEPKNSKKPATITTQPARREGNA